MFTENGISVTAIEVEDAEFYKAEIVCRPEIRELILKGFVLNSRKHDRKVVSSGQRHVDIAFSRFKIKNRAAALFTDQQRTSLGPFFSNSGHVFSNYFASEDSAIGAAKLFVSMMIHYVAEEDAEGAMPPPEAQEFFVDAPSIGGVLETWNPFNERERPSVVSDFVMTVYDAPDHTIVSRLELVNDDDDHDDDDIREGCDGDEDDY